MRAYAQCAASVASAVVIMTMVGAATAACTPNPLAELTNCATTGGACNGTSLCTAQTTVGMCTSGVCQGPPNCTAAYNSSCTTSDGDGGGAMCPCGLVCKQGQCKLAGQGVNEYCSTSDECVSGSCVNSRCSAGALGQPCNDAACDYGLYCKFDGAGSTCAQTLPAGAQCTATEQCAPGTDCFDGSCVALLSLPNGTPVPLYAAALCKSGYSITANSSATHGTCSEPLTVNHAGEKCTEAAPGFYCVCSGAGGTGVLVPQASSALPAASQALLTCLLKNKCEFLAATCLDCGVYGSCSYFNCAQERADYFCASTGSVVAREAQVTSVAAPCVRAFLDRTLLPPTTCQATEYHCQPLPHADPCSPRRR